MLLVVIGLHAWLSNREQKREAQGLPRHGGFRLALAVLAGLVILFSGGCGGLFLIGWLIEGAPRNSYVS